MTFKDWWRNYKSIGIFCIIFLLFLICFMIWNFIWNKKNEKQTEEWVDISDFPTTLEIDKEWKLLSYPEITVLAETDWQVVNLNVTEWDIVEQRDILMQIWNENWEIMDTDIDITLWRQFAEYYNKKGEYNQFESEFWEKISILEKELIDNNTLLSIAIDTENEENKKNIQEKMRSINEELTLLKNQKEKLKSEVTRLDNKILLDNQENIEYLYEIDKYSPRANIPWIVGNIYVHEWDKIQNWDKLCTIIDNTYSPEIEVWLDFNEYVLTQDLTWVLIVTENENRWDSYYEWEIYTRSPKINEDWEYTLTVRILEEVSDLILNDKNTKITVIFTKDYPTIWIPKNCFTEIWKNNWILTLRDGEVITWIEVWIENKWENWINVDNLKLFWLENEEEKDGMNLCIEDWNKIIKNWDNNPILHEDESLIEWRNQFDNVEDLCKEFIKVNPMYWSGHRNASIISLLWWSGEKIEVLCRLE